jgi:hypothetical protein
MTHLSGLDLRGTKITDAGLADIKRMTNLSQVYLSRTQVTEAGMKELRRARPSLKIPD